MSGEAPAVREALPIYATEAPETERVPPGYKQTEVGVIPEDWEVSSVGREFTIQLGKMLDAAKNVGVLKPYIGNRAVQWGRINLEDLATVAMTPSDLQRFRLQRGDLLVCEGGEIGRAALWNEPIAECYYQKALHRLRPIRGYEALLLLYLLQLWTSNGYLSNYVTQTSIAHLPKDKFELVPLAIPPKSEQRAIAASLSDVDALITALNNLIAKKRAVKTAAMQQLLTGKQRLPGFNSEWANVELQELGSFSKGKDIKKHQVVSDGIPCVRYGEIYTLHHDYIKEFHSFIPASVVRRSRRIRRGDLLFTGSGETIEEIGKCVAYLGDQEAYAGGDIVIFSPARDDSMFLGYLMNHSSVVAQKASMGQGDAVVHISARNLARLRFALPPVEEQTAIATVLSDMDAEISALEARREKTRQVKQGMMQELLTGRIRLKDKGYVG